MKRKRESALHHRLTRFNFEVYRRYLTSHDVELICINDKKIPKTYEEELVEDLLTLMASFSAKLYGKRSSENRKKSLKLEASKNKIPAEIWHN